MFRDLTLNVFLVAILISRLRIFQFRDGGGDLSFKCLYNNIDFLSLKF